MKTLFLILTFVFLKYMDDSIKSCQKFVKGLLIVY